METDCVVPFTMVEQPPKSKPSDMAKAIKKKFFMGPLFVDKRTSYTIIRMMQVEIVEQLAEF